MDHSRLHYMDNLRAVVMIAGVFFHAALAYSPLFQPVWLYADQVNSPVVDYFANFLHIFRMPLFFIVAGFFAALLVERRGVGAMLKNRSMRILLPFIIFWPLISAAIIVQLLWALENVNNLSPLLQHIAAMQSTPDAEQPPPSTMHLWFLYYLMFFYVLVWVCRAVVPVALKDKIIALHPLMALGALPLVLVPGLSAGMVPFAAPDSFIPQLWAFGFFGLFFAYGYILYSSSRLVDYFQKLWPVLVVVSIAIFIPLQLLYPEQVGFDATNPPWPQRIIMILCIAYISVFMSVAGLVFAKNLLNRRNAFMRYMSDASYWIYIAHLPVVFGIQYWLLDQPSGLLVKFAISAFGTLAICVATYFMFVRWTPIGWLLNGRRKAMEKQSTAPIASAASK